MLSPFFLKKKSSLHKESLNLFNGNHSNFFPFHLVDVKSIKWLRH